MRRTSLLALIATAILVVAGLGISLGLGAPDPALAERSALGALGALLLSAVLVSSSSALPEPLGAPRPRGEPNPKDGSGPGSGADQHADQATRLARHLRFAAAAAGDFHQLVRPRLQQIATEVLQSSEPGRAGRSATELLGPDLYRLVDPEVAPPEDRLAPGVALGQVEALVERLEQLGASR